MNTSLVDEGLKIIKQASIILEGISNTPGVTPTQFFAALDSVGIHEIEQRATLLQAATTIELSLEQIDEITHPIVH